MSFVTWMLGWPIFGVEESEYIRLHSEMSDAIMSAVMVAIWLVVGRLLYVKPKGER